MSNQKKTAENDVHPRLDSKATVRKVVTTTNVPVFVLTMTKILSHLKYNSYQWNTEPSGHCVCL
jgi:hypothetical protein